MAPNFKRLKEMTKWLGKDEMESMMDKLSWLLPVKDEEVTEEPKEESKEESPEEAPVEESSDTPVEDEPVEWEVDVTVITLNIEDGDPYIKNIWVCDEAPAVAWVKVEWTSSWNWEGYDELLGNVDETDWQKGKDSNMKGKGKWKNSWLWFFDNEASTNDVDKDIDSALANDSVIVEKIYWDWKQRYDDSNWKAIWDSLAGYVTKYVVMANRISYNNKALDELISDNIDWVEYKQIKKILDDNLYMRNLLNIAVWQISSEQNKSLDTK